MKIKLVFKGGEGSGNFGHEGRPGLVGGSGSGGSGSGGSGSGGSGELLSSKRVYFKNSLVNYSEGDKFVTHKGKVMGWQDVVDEFGKKGVDHLNQAWGIKVMGNTGERLGHIYDYFKGMTNAQEFIDAYSNAEATNQGPSLSEFLHRQY